MSLKWLLVVSCLGLAWLSGWSREVRAQSAEKYDFFRYPQSHAASLNPIGPIFGRWDGYYEWRLDPNFSRRIEIAYQPNVRDTHKNGTFDESAISIGLTERLYLYDNAAIQAQFAGVGLGVALIRKTVALRITTEIGYKWIFSNGAGNFYIEPMVLLDAYVVTNHDCKRIIPVLELPVGYAW